MITELDLITFLTSDENELIFDYYDDKKRFDRITKSKYNDNNILIYYQNSYKITDFPEKNVPEYVGFYNINKCQFFNLSVWLDFCKSEKTIWTEKKMQERIEFEVHNITMDNCENLDTSKINDLARQQIDSNIDYYKENLVYKQTCERQFFGEEFNFGINPRINFEQLITYIDLPGREIEGMCNRRDYCKKLAQEYIDNNTPDLYYTLLKYRYYMQSLTPILRNTYHIVNKRAAVYKLTQEFKTANVTICKDDIKFTFKFNVLGFKSFDKLWTNYISESKDKHKFGSLFGENYFEFYEIESITHGKQIIYSKKFEEMAS